MSATKISQELSRKHPLQRLESPSTGISALIHVIGLASFSYSYKYLFDFPNPISESYGWHFQFLTIIGLTVAATAFLFGLAADLTSSRRLFSIKNTLAATAAPLEVLISILYWTLRFTDASLVMPDWADPLTLPADISFHALPSLFLVLDLLLLSPPRTVGLPAFLTSTFLAFAYWFWVELCYSHNGFYPYPLFEALSTPQRVGLFAFSGALMSGSALGLGVVYRWVNGGEGV
ncbi:integral membrane protein [Lophium mytilinum]|uniref:Integral membrane protein n=1 Tax=Lophium mytilinum TaxID=390894 RepID=A0A6A6R7B5_9PEZI|nr:integral membrane protein [Lophium mytilinum]